MCGTCRNGSNAERPFKNFKGKRGGNLYFEFLMIFLGSICCGFCEELSMVSVPLGFEISGYEQRHWISENGVFAFGYLPDYQKDDGFVVGIWYNKRERGGAVLPVWTVGGGIRVSQNSTFQLSVDGNFVLFDNPSGILVWNSNTSSLGVEEASLLNNGNLVLGGFGKKVVWESFHSPTDTLLPGQSLHFHQALQAPSKNSIAGFYSFVVRQSGDVALLWDGNVTYWSSHLSSLVVVDEARFEANGVFGLFDATNQIVWYKSSKDFRDPSVLLRHLRLDADGNLRIYSWDEVLHTWRVGWQAVENQCDVFGSCGLYSVCGYNSSGPTCDCLVQDSLSSGVGASSDSVSYGCKKMVDLANCKRGTSMMVLKRTALYGLYPPHDFDLMLSTESCKKYCLKDSSCFAATAKNDGSGLCTIKRTGFISGYRYSSVSATSFLKVCLVPQAVSTQEASLHKDPLMPLSKQPSTHKTVDHRDFILGIVVLFLVTSSVLLTVQMLVFWFIHRRRQIKAQSRVPFQKDAQMNPLYSALIRLSFEEVKELTNNFVDQLGPTVFKGVLPNQMAVVTKLLDNVGTSERDFRMVVSTLGGTHHRNLVPLRGFCFEPEHRFLLYEYISNGSLDQWLVNLSQNGNSVSWQQRLNIAIGVARAIAYLHTECQQCIAHGNLKLENVLLDEQLVAKVTDFGLQNLSAKENSSSSETLAERDIYMFGEMLLQIVVGKSGSVEGNMYSSAYEKCRDEKLSAIISAQSEEKVELEVVERTIKIAFWCMQDQPFLRPSIGEVVKVLEGSLSVDSPPASAAFLSKGNQKTEGDVGTIEAPS